MNEPLIGIRCIAGSYAECKRSENHKVNSAAKNFDCCHVRSLEQETGGEPVDQKLYALTAIYIEDRFGHLSGDESIQSGIVGVIQASRVDDYFCPHWSKCFGDVMSELVNSRGSIELDFDPQMQH